MCERSVSAYGMEDVRTAQSMWTAFSCPSTASYKESSYPVWAALLDTISMVSIFVMIIFSELILAITLSILAGIVFLVIRQGPAREADVPKKRLLFLF